MYMQMHAGELVTVPLFALFGKLVSIPLFYFRTSHFYSSHKQHES